MSVEDDQTLEVSASGRWGSSDALDRAAKLSSVDPVVWPVLVGCVRTGECKHTRPETKQLDYLVQSVEGIARRKRNWASMAYTLSMSAPCLWRHGCGCGRVWSGQVCFLSMLLLAKTKIGWGAASSLFGVSWCSSFSLCWFLRDQTDPGLHWVPSTLKSIGRLGFIECSPCSTVKWSSVFSPGCQHFSSIALVSSARVAPFSQSVWPKLSNERSQLTRFALVPDHPGT